MDSSGATSVAHEVRSSPIVEWGARILGIVAYGISSFARAMHTKV